METSTLSQIAAELMAHKAAIASDDNADLVDAVRYMTSKLWNSELMCPSPSEYTKRNTVITVID